MTLQENIAYLGNLAELLKIERDEDWNRFQKQLKEQPVNARVREGLTWFPLKIVEEGFGFGSYPFLVVEKTNGPAKHSFQSGQPVELFSNHENHEGESLKGTIAFVDHSRMKIQFRIDELPEWTDDGRIGLNISFDEKSYKEMFAALNNVINAKNNRLAEIRDAIVDDEKRICEKEFQDAHGNLNDSQNDAVRGVVNDLIVSVVHGPPGTGKTTTLIGAMEELAGLKKKVLCCAPSNAAVDHLVEGLGEKGLKVLRLGNPAKVHSKANAFTVDVKLIEDKDYSRVREWKRKAKELRSLGSKYKRSFGREEAEQRKLIFKEAKEMMREARETELFLLDRLIDQADVICTTLVGSANEMLRDRIFDVVVIDEAGQALEPSCWIPISKGNKLVLAGDHLQLPPTIFSNEAAQRGLAISLMERAASVEKGVHFLNVQYRMNEKIAAFSNKHFYEGKLTADISVAHRMLEGDLNPIQFIDTAGTGYNEEAGAEGNSRMNKGEAELAMKMYSLLKEQTQHFFSCALISPYRAQIELLERVFKEEEVTINTVDSFQGQEADVVIISLVRSNDENEIGFLKDYRRMNVALTRARKKLIVIGDSATIGGDLFYQEMIQFFELQESYESAWIYMN
ncbi:MAG: hypothetical protein RLZZ71_851 [Bacteroidota bacterium]|jgi:superfamily I DNA and/or RNA helicase